ncbi:hypothetical protein IAT38_007216 [Cryptococcus sp. DSM 104549]
MSTANQPPSQRQTKALQADQAATSISHPTVEQNGTPFPLPFDLVSYVLRCGSEQGHNGGHELLRSALRVNTTFYLAAAPLLYSRPTVFDLGTFFLGADVPVSPSILSMPPGAESDLLYLKSGNTKLPLLRHLRCLTVPADRLPGRSWGPKAAAMRKRDALKTSIAQAQRILQKIQNSPTPLTPFPFLPSFDAVTLHALPLPALPLLSRQVYDPSTGMGMSHILAPFLPVLLNAGPLPKALCCSDTQGFPSPPLGLWLSCTWGICPSILCYHTDFQSKPNQILWGSTTRIYVNSTFHERGKSLYESNWAGNLFEKEGLRALLAALATSQSSWRRADMAQWNKISRETRVEVYGLEEIVEFEWVMDGGVFTDELENGVDDETTITREQRDDSRDLNRMEKRLSSLFRRWSLGYHVPR